MKIDRNNYEEYFLLYADDELSDGEKIEVLQFIREHKDLEAEFRMILDTVCKPDDTVFENKASLIRSAGAEPISEKNYEEIFVQYHDGELNEDERRSTELFVSTHPQLQKEFESIGIAKFSPDHTIQFPGKKHLYKKEKAGKVRPIVFWRSMAAAVFTGFSLWFFLYYQQHEVRPVAVNPAPGIQKTLPEAVKESRGSDADVTSVLKDETPGKKILKQDNPTEKVKVPQKKQEPAYTAKVEKPTPPEVIPTVIKNRKIDDDINENAVTKSIDVPVNDITANRPLETIESSTNDVAIEGEKKENFESSSEKVAGAQQASFINTNDNTDNYVFYNVTTQEFRKSKVGGFLKKVKRIVERSNPITRLLSGDDEQIVANQKIQ